MTDHAPLLPFVHVVLSRPSEPRNVGAACRAIKNFGIHRLTVVTTDSLDRDAARPLAAWADDILDTARIVPTLLDAVAGDALVAGITRRLGQKRKQRPYAPWEFARLCADRFGGSPAPGAGSVAVVFGNEQSGLSDDELLACHVAVAIPTSPACPSMNLSHAVGVICYEMARTALHADAVLPGAEPPREPDTIAPFASAEAASGGTPVTPELDLAAGRVIDALDRLDYHSHDGPQGMRTFVRDLAARASLSRDELARFIALFEKLAGIHGRAPRGTESRRLP